MGNPTVTLNWFDGDTIVKDEDGRYHVLLTVDPHRHLIFEPPNKVALMEFRGDKWICLELEEAY